MGQIYENILNTYEVLGIDFRRGTFYPIKTGTVAKNNTPVIVKGKAILSSANYYNFSTYAIGLNDFTCIVKNSEIIGAGTTSPLTSSGGKLRLTLDGTNYDSSVAFSASAKTFAVSVDRSGNANFYQDGAALGSAVDVSAKAAVDIATSVYSVQDFDSRVGSEYAFLVIGYAITATLAQLTSELESMPEQRHWSSAFNFWKFAAKGNALNKYLNTQVPSYATGALEVFVKYSGLDNTMFAGGVTANPSRFYFGINGAQFVMGYGAQSWITIRGTTLLKKNNIYKVRYEFGATNKIYVNEKLEYNAASSGTPGNSNIILFAGDSVPSFATSNICWDFKFYDENDKLIARYPLQGNLLDYSGNGKNAVNIGATNIDFTSVNYSDPELYFKGEMGAIANETTISSGYLENTGAQILSGSFKMIAETNNSKLEKVIECVTDGSIYIPQANAALAGWRRYIDTGGGYEPFITDLATARTIALTAGKKLIWASENPERSLYQLA